MTIETRSALAAAALAPLASFPAAVVVVIVYFSQPRVAPVPEPVTEALSAWLLFGGIATLVAYLCMAFAGLPAALIALRLGAPHLWIALLVGVATGVVLWRVSNAGTIPLAIH